MSGLSKRTQFDVRFALHDDNKSRILQCRACQNGHHLMSVLIFTTTTQVEFCNNLGLSKRAPFDVHFALHYNNKSRILQCRACQDGHHLMSVLIFTTTTKEVFCNGGLYKTGTIWCPFGYSLQLQKKNSAIMADLSKRAPFDVRFALHYNYKSRILPQCRACQNGHHLMSVLLFTTTTKEVFCNGGLYKTGTIWCPFCYSLQLQKKNSAIMADLSKRAPFDVRFALHYNYKSRNLPQCRAWQNDVRFALHYNYKGII